MAQNPTSVDLHAAFTDHDRLFKELLTVFFVEFVELFLPNIAARLDTENISFLNQESFRDLAGGKKRVVDLLAQVRLQGDGRDEEMFLLIHVENQAKSQPRFARRMFHIFARLDEQYDLPIYPVALFSFDKPLRAEPDRYRVVVTNHVIEDFYFHTIQLNRLHWRDYLNQPNPVAAALMAKMQIAQKDRPKVKSECLRLLATLRLDPARTQLITGFIDNYLKLTASEIQEFEREVALLPKEEQEAIVPLTISWKEEGRVEEARALILRLGQKRFGNPDSATVATLQAISSLEDLERLFERLLEVENWTELRTFL